MAIFQKGADPAALEAAATRLTGYAGELDGVRSGASGAVHSLQGQWGGGDLDHLLGRWPAVEYQLTSCSGTLGKMAAALRRNAAAQTSTSAGGIGSPGGPPGPMAPTGGLSLPVPPGAPDPDGPGADDPSLPDDPHFGDPAQGDDIPLVPGDGGDDDPDHDSPWVPQGVSVTPDGTRVTSYYDQDDTGNGLLVIEQPEGTVLQVPVTGNDHFGGVAVEGDNVYVSGNGQDGKTPTVQQYSLAGLQSGQTGPVSSTEVETGSTVAVHGDHVYVAKFNSDGPGTVYSYPVDASGRVSAESDGSSTSPAKVQGLAVTDDSYYYSSSEGRYADHSTLYRVDRETGEVIDTQDIPRMSEGITLHDGQITAVHESGSNEYNHKEGWDRFDPTKDLDPDDHYTDIPLEEG